MPTPRPTSSQSPGRPRLAIVRRTGELATERAYEPNAAVRAELTRAIEVLSSRAARPGSTPSVPPSAA